MPQSDESVTFQPKGRRWALSLTQGGVTWPRATGKVLLHLWYCLQRDSHTQTQQWYVGVELSGAPRCEIDRTSYAIDGKM